MVGKHLENVLIIMRGVPGSGKSHEARLFAPARNVYSTDDYFTGKNPGVTQPGGYRENWAGNKLGQAHAWNIGRVLTALEENVPTVVVDNTNIRRRDAAVYARMAKDRGYEVHVMESSSPWWQEIQMLLRDKRANSVALNEWARKLADGFYSHDIMATVGNTHGVPADVIARMLADYDPYTVEDLLA